MNTMHSTLRLAALTLGVLLACAAAAQDSGQRSVDLAIDSVSGRLIPNDGSSLDRVRFWADPERNTIVRQDANGGAATDAASGLNVPYGLGYDAGAELLIWTSSGDEVMQVMPLAGGDVRALTTSFDDPPVIELPYEGGKQAIAFVDGAVVRVTVDAHTDAQHNEVLYTPALGEAIIGLALDTQTNQVYVGNAVGMAARKIDLASGAVATLIFTDHVAPIPDRDIDPEPIVDLGAPQ
jgi:hypothetical protein